MTSPLRTCVACRVVEPAAQLLRIAAVGDVAQADPARRVPGRGCWIHPTVECLDVALKRRAITRALSVCRVDEDGIRAHLRVA